MKKVSSLMIFLLMAFMAQAELVDNFDDYQLGAIGTVTTTWTGLSDGGVNPSTASIVVDPADSANQVIQLTEGGGTGQQWVRATLNPAATIAQSTTGTLFVRFRATASLDQSFGLTDLDTASNDWAHFRVQIAVVNGQIRVRNSAGAQTLASVNTPTTAVALNTDWYYLWVVVDNAADTSKLYLNQTGADATEADRLVTLNNPTANTFTFRSAADSLDRFLWRAQNNVNTRLLMLDDINIAQGQDLSVPARTKPYGPSVTQIPAGATVNVSLQWNAGADPAGASAVNPAIVNQYVFTAAPTDTTLYYRGATGVDPGTEDPASQYAINGLAYDTTYRWAIVEAIAGYEQTFTVGTSPITAVDPNNIIGPTWSFDSLTSSPVITQQPAQARVLNTDPSATFTCEFTSVDPAAVDWYKAGNPTPLVNGGDIAISLEQDGNAYTATLQISTPVDADQGDYYCEINNGTPKVTSASATLVINKLLAQYDFEGSLAPAAGSAADAPAGQGKSVNGLADANSLLASNVALDFVPGLNGAGQAVQMDPNQYIDFGTNGYPKASSLTGQIGGGLDAGTILCWVKPNTATHRLGVLANYNLDITTGIGFSIETNQDLRINIRGEAAEIMTAQGQPNRPEYDIFDGQWHLLGVVWDAQAQASAVYVDGQWVTNDGSMGTPATYAAWQRGVLVGAGRQGSPNRHLLTDFFSGAMDNLRIYNYRKTADDIAQEYYAATNVLPCTNMTFVGSDRNFDNTGSSYCAVDLADFMMIASKWLNSGLYVP